MTDYGPDAPLAFLREQERFFVVMNGEKVPAAVGTTFTFYDGDELRSAHVDAVDHEGAVTAFRLGQIEHDYDPENDCTVSRFVPDE